jgi:uncharacterized protein YjbI with pentapeptide repeats
MKERERASQGTGKYQMSIVCGGVVQLVRTPACHSGGRGFESRRSRQFPRPVGTNSIKMNSDMADYPLLELLREGSVAWNGWRHNNPHVKPNLGGANLNGLVLDGANLDDVVLFETMLANTSLVGASLRRVVLQGADLRGAILRSADLSDADFSGTWYNDPPDPTVRLAYPTSADLRDTSLHDTLFARTMLRGCQFSGARLNRTIFSDVNLSLAQGLEDAIHEGPSQVTV